MEPTKIFFDMLFDYRYLKYIFKYGFFWDDDITKFLLSKSSQRVRELSNAISDSVYENCVTEPWYEHANGGRTKKSGRLLVRQNHYRLLRNQWFQNLCGCCGNFSDMAAEETIRRCTQGPYSRCRDEREKEACPYRRLCSFKEEREAFLELLGGVAREDAAVWKSNWIHKMVFNSYGDIIMQRDTGGIVLKENSWKEFFEPSPSHTGTGHSGHASEKNSRKKFPQPERFSDMLCFFSGFTPMSVLGWNFLKRQGRRTNASYIIARNLPMEFEFEQEYIYRCLHAINRRKNVICEDKEYVPVKLFYRDRGLAGVKEHLYLKAVPLAGESIHWDEAVDLPLSGGVHVRPGGKIPQVQGTETEKKAPEHGERPGSGDLPDRGKLSGGKGQREEDTREFQVEFYYNSDTEYLIGRRKEGWGEFIVDTSARDEIKTMESPYYKDHISWNVDVVTYRIEVSDVPGFRLFIRSFGDFARIVGFPESLEEPLESAGVTAGARQKGLIMEHESLLSVYNSDVLMEEAQNRGKRLPPRQAELQWLDFVLREYPGFCSIFLEPESIDEVKEKLAEECQGREWFDRERFDFGPRVKDLEMRVCPKYRRILDAIYEGRILRYVHHDEQVRIVPYALEYDVTRHLAGGNREPMDIMCYDLDEKRTVNIPYKKIETRDSLSREEHTFSELEKMYHVLAYAIRCGTMGKLKIDEKTAHFLECVWKPDPRGEDNYNRLIRKKAGKERSIVAEYEKFAKLCRDNEKQEAETFFRRVFDYWKTMEEKSGERNKYQAFLLSCFRDGCKRLWSPRAGRDVKEALEKISDREIWELISGSPVDGVVNEIAYFNENLKNQEVSFVLKDRNEEAVEKVYNVFRNFICAGERLKDGRLKFTVSYESFFYRKIHMALMVLSDLIEDVEPEKTGEIIRKRIKNKEKSDI